MLGRGEVRGALCCLAYTVVVWLEVLLPRKLQDSFLVCWRGYMGNIRTYLLLQLARDSLTYIGCATPCFLVVCWRVVMLRPHTLLAPHFHLGRKQPNLRCCVCAPYSQLAALLCLEPALVRTRKWCVLVESLGALAAEAATTTPGSCFSAGHHLLCRHVPKRGVACWCAGGLCMPACPPLGHVLLPCCTLLVLVIQPPREEVGLFVTHATELALFFKVRRSQLRPAGFARALVFACRVAQMQSLSFFALVGVCSVSAGVCCSVGLRPHATTAGAAKPLLGWAMCSLACFLVPTDTHRHDLCQLTRTDQTEQPA